MKRIALSFVAAICLAPTASLAAPKGTVTVECPLTRAKTEVTSALPSGWWQTPQVGDLIDRRTQNIGGDLTLMCGYSAYGTTVYVMRKFPPGTRTCTPQGANAFSCRP